MKRDTPLTILIAEDNAILAKSIARRLRQIGYIVETVPNAAAFHHSYSKMRYSAICLDLQLPDGNGLDLLEFYIRANRDNVPVIVITGTGTDLDRDRAKRNEAAGFLIKPFAISDLILILEQQFGNQLSAGAS